MAFPVHIANGHGHQACLSSSGLSATERESLCPAEPGPAFPLTVRTFLFCLGNLSPPYSRDLYCVFFHKCPRLRRDGVPQGPRASATGAATVPAPGVETAFSSARARRGRFCRMPAGPARAALPVLAVSHAPSFCWSRRPEYHTSVGHPATRTGMLTIPAGGPGARRAGLRGCGPIDGFSCRRRKGKTVSRAAGVHGHATGRAWLPHK